MPCRASPPPPPPHSTLDLTPTPISQSSPLVYRLRTCCLREFLPRVAITQQSSSILTNSHSPGSSIYPSSSTQSSSINTPYHATSSPTSSQYPHSTASPSFGPRPATQLTALFTDPHYASSESVTSTETYSNHLDKVQLTSALNNAFSKWLPPTSNIPLAQLQLTLAHRFLRWTLSDGPVEKPLEEENVAHQELESEKDQTHHNHDFPCTIDHTSIVNSITENQAQQMLSLNSAGLDWAAAHDLVWPEGDYYIAQKTCIREGVAHLKRGRRYIFVEPVLGPASPFLYPNTTSNSTEAEESNVSDEYDSNEESSLDTAFTESENTTDNEDQIASSPLPNEESNLHRHDQNKDKNDETPEIGDEVSSSDSKNETEESEIEDRAQTGPIDKMLPLCDNERAEKEEIESDARGDNINTTNNSSSVTESTETNNNLSSSSSAASSSTSFSDLDNEDIDEGSNHIMDFSKLLPYSPLLDPSTDGQEQFEYGLYELQYIPKIQHLSPQQFLPTRQSFIVHLDEDRPTLASPVPIHSRRAECRCQLMVRKALMQQDLLQVWPSVAPIRTLQEKQQEAEEEARIKEIKQKVQMQAKNWRQSLQTQMVACG
ncbi:hypothetical protein BGZ76_009130 [Entomortierella beljakovae]|nr:hypothetical protein BGZ76_009130 [Entomortierella beljakovae]